MKTRGGLYKIIVYLGLIAVVDLNMHFTHLYKIYVLRCLENIDFATKRRPKQSASTDIKNKNKSAVIRTWPVWLLAHD